MVDKLAIFQEARVALSPIAFVRDIPNQISLMELSSYELTKELEHLFVYQTAAYRISEPMTQIDKREIKELILSRFKRLSINELYYAFKLHRSREIGQEITPYGYISVSFVARILDFYVEWKIETRQKNNIPISLSTVNQDITPEQKKKNIVSGVLRMYDQYQEHKIMPVGSLYVYDVLYDVGLLPTDSATKWEYYKRAKEGLKFQAYNEKKGPALDMRRLRKIKELLADIEKKDSSEVQIQAKKDIVADFFKKHKREQVEAFLNDKY